jgi:hypothetical protein
MQKSIKSPTWKPGRRLFHRSERGDALLEFVVILPLSGLLIATIALFGPYIHIHVATNMAAYDCAISAVQSLDKSQGYMQGLVAAQASFEAFRLPWGRTEVSVKGNWSREGQVMCSVSYHVPLGNLPFAKVTNAPAVVTHEVALPVQAYKSEWK